MGKHDRVIKVYHGETPYWKLEARDGEAGTWAPIEGGAGTVIPAKHAGLSIFDVSSSGTHLRPGSVTERTTATATATERTTTVAAAESAIPAAAKGDPAIPGIPPEPSPALDLGEGSGLPAGEPLLHPLHFHQTSALRDYIGDRLPVVASVSGGKDSTAMCLYLKELGIPFRAVFADTGWEVPETYDYVRALPDMLDCEIAWVRAEYGVDQEGEYRLTEDQLWRAQEVEKVLGLAYSAMVRSILKKGMFSSRVGRFCTEYLKVRPIMAWVDANIDTSPIRAVGVRREESNARTDALEWEEEQDWDGEIWRPLVHWTEPEVVDIHKTYGIAPNPLYLKGASRVGCAPCIFARKHEIRMFAEMYPERVDAIELLEKHVGELAAARYAEKGETFESLGYSPPCWFQNPASRTNLKKGTKAGSPWPIRDVVEWAKTKRGGWSADGDHDFEPLAPLPHEEGCIRWGFCDTSWRESEMTPDPPTVKPETVAQSTEPVADNKSTEDVEPPTFRVLYDHPKWFPPLRMRSPIKWVGGKGSSVSDILKHLPESFPCYWEPFLGGGALFWVLASEPRRRFEQAVISDANEALIAMYMGLRDHCEMTIAGLCELVDKHNAAITGLYELVDGHKITRHPDGTSFYNSVRSAFNAEPKQASARLAAMFLYLNKYGFNGIYRTNQSGEFNVPMGSNGKKRVDAKFLFDFDNLRKVSGILNQPWVYLECCDAIEALDWGKVGVGDVVYLDPPYVPEPKRGNYGEKPGSYGAKEGFSLEQQQKLAARAVDAIEREGATILASNADQPIVHALWPARWFARTELTVARPVAAKSKSRAPVGELLLVSRSDWPDDGHEHLGPRDLDLAVLCEELNLNRKKANKATKGKKVSKKDAIENPPHVVSVTSNIKSVDGEPWTVELGETVTCFVGNSGSGKSRIVNAIELALTGRASDVAGRDPKMPAELASLAPGRAGRVFAEVKFSNGETASWTMEVGDDGHATRALPSIPSFVLPDSVLPVRPLRDALLGSVDTARQFFLRRTADTITTKDVLAHLPESKHALYGDVAKGFKGPAGTAVDILLYVSSEAKARAKAIDDEVKTAKALIAAVGESVGDRPTEHQIATLRQQHETVQGQLKAISLHSTRQIWDAYVQWATLYAQCPAPPVADAETEAALAQATQAAAQKREIISALSTVFSTAVEKGLQACPCCETPGVADKLAQQKATFEQLVAQLNTTGTVAEAPPESGMTVQMQTEAGPIERWMSRTELGEMSQRFFRQLPPGFQPTELDGLPEITMSRPDAEATAQKVAVQLQQAELVASRWDDIKAAREVVANADERKAKWSSLQSLCKDARDALVKASVAEFEKLVNKYLPDEDAFGILIEEGGRDTFRMGLWSEGGAYLRTALSGAEWARVLTALAVVCRPEKSPAVVIPEERAFDPETLAQVLRALKDAPCQVVITSVVPPKGRLAKAITVIDVASDVVGVDGDSGGDGDGDSGDGNGVSEPPNDNGGGSIEVSP